MSVRELIYTTEEVAKLFGITKATLFQRVAKGKIPAIHVSKRGMIFEKSVINDLINPDMKDAPEETEVHQEPQEQG